ncbi:hypothetical protein SynPROS91_00199 [Synechococcus sp. PROS-9-1]|uniref:polysialyltransferase family glycosyltransferase n=1 Tax=Synechococcus sp. PROS-9-1 TaxID=1968775 RepID=UPI0016469DBF|nr:polysialyltransferase family glycosyltransferase [Synechococcus sp. PROS-9-1]QNJ30627.1 hypothetical protein SynPROS91_00199 [Synechococcus sp. PROS-9-1]
MYVRLIWIAPDIASLRYNNASDILRQAFSALRKENYNVKMTIYVYTLDNFSPIDSAYDDISVEYIPSAATIFSRNSREDFKFIFFDGYRLPDKLSLLCVNIRKPQNVRTFYIQHGRYTKLSRKVINMHILKKSIFYSIFLLRTLFHLPLSTLNLLFFRSPVVADFAFIYCPLQYWIRFHSMHRLLFKSPFLIQDRDMKRFSLKSRIFYSIKKPFLYIAQTLVEDGRCSKDQFFDFWRSLVAFSLRYGLSIDIRLHPRSSNKLWQEIQSNTQDVEFNLIASTEFPRYDFVITHNSAMSVFFLNNSIPVYFFSLSSEPLPLGLGNHPLSRSFEFSNNASDGLFSCHSHPSEFSNPYDLALEDNLSLSDDAVREVDLEAEIEYLTLTTLKSCSF